MDGGGTEESAGHRRGYGPGGAPGMPESGNCMPIPRRLYRHGAKDFVRITDRRMSGGPFGTVILHCAPESAVGAPLAAVRDGDIICIDAGRNLLEPEASDGTKAERMKVFNPNCTKISEGVLCAISSIMFCRLMKAAT